MVDHANFSEDRPERLAAARGLVPHPLFPRHDGRPEDRDIRFVSFRRRLPDGRVEHCPDDIPAHEVRSWADVTGSWGGGEYQAVGKDELRQVVAVYPDGDDEWILFNFESRPFGSRNGSRPGGITQAPAVRDAPSPPAQAPSPAPWPPFAPHYAHPHAQPPPAYAMVASGPAPSPPNPHGSPAPATLIATPYGYVVAAPAHAHAPPAPAAPPLPPGYAPAAGYAPGAPAVGYAPGTPAVGYAPAQPDPAPLYAYGTPAPAPGYAHALPVSVAAASQAHAIPAPQPAQAMHEPLAALIKELIREVRALRDPAPAPAAPPAPPAAPPPSGPSQSETMMATMLNSQAELVRGVVTAALGSRSADAAAQPAPEPAAQALQMLRAIKELGLPGPGQAQPSMTERLHELRVLKELTTPAPPAAPAPVASEIGEIFSGITTLMQAEAAKAAATSAAEPRPAPQERRPPPPPRYLLHVPGIGLVDVVHPEPPAAPAPSLPARADNGLMLDAIKRDPALRASVLAALGIELAVVPSSPAPIAAPIAAPVPSAPPTPSPMAPQPPRVDPPNAPEPVATPVPIAPAPTPPSAPAFIAPAPTEPSPPPPPAAPASTPASDERVLGAEPTVARAGAPRAITDDDRMRAVYALQTIARMPPDQRRAELAKLPGMEGNVDMFVQVLQNVDDISPDAWTRFAAALPPDAVRVLVYGPGA